MKKHNEGYALVLVLVVITVLSLVAMAMTAASLKNLQNQQKSIERMQAKYAAQGEMEKAVVNLEEKLKAATNETGTVISADILNTDMGDIKVKCTAVKYYLGPDEETAGEDLQKDHDYLQITLRTTNESAPVVECVIQITGRLKNESNTCTVYKGMAWQYVSYTITEGGGG